MSNSTTTPFSSTTTTPSFSLPPTTSSSTTTTTSTTSPSSIIPSSTSTTTPSSVVTTITSSIFVSPTPGSSSKEVVTITSTSSPSPTPPAQSSTTSSTTNTKSTSTTSAAPALGTSGASSSGGHGLKTGGKIAIAVVVPIVVIAALVIAALFFWKRRKARKSAEEERRKEVEEYGYNPNNDPTLPAVGSNYGDTRSEMQEDNSGYRGWGATSSTQRKPSTNLGGSTRGTVGMAVSDTASTPSGANAHHSEGHSGDPLVGSPTSENEAVGALGGAPAAGANNRDINRGPSNASSAYTGHARSEGSDEAGEHSPQLGGGPNFHDETNYYPHDAQPNHGPYGDGSYGGGQPVIRDVQARRNTRIEKPSVFPQQGNAGISQNF